MERPGRRRSCDEMICRSMCIGCFWNMPGFVMTNGINLVMSRIVWTSNKLNKSGIRLVLRALATMNNGR